MKPHPFFAGLMLTTSMPGAGAVAATTVYDVSSTSVIDCSNASHELWTNQAFAGPCANYFDISAVFTYEEGVSATLMGAAVNPQSLIADINLALSDFTETGRYKQENGIAYSSADNTPDIDFFRDGSGQIRTSDGSDDVYDVSLFKFNFQFGAGANAKSSDDFSAAAWITSGQQTGATAFGGSHWDLNLQLTRPVPEPGSLALLGTAALALAAFRSGRRH